jgi:predicted Zn finger-like uncharacterized protein
MIVKCSRCNGLMRVDESALPQDPRVKVRCPHCKEIGLLAEMTASEASFHGEPSEIATPPTSGSGALGDEAIDSPRSGVDAGDSSEPTIPSDAFRDFRFPAERQTVKPTKPSEKSRIRLLIFALVSLAVVAFFALLVNLVLPGPSGSAFYKGAIPEGTTPETATQSAPHPGR